MARAKAKKIATLMRDATRSEDKPITLLFFAAGVILTLLQYREHLETQRVKFSYEHVREWETGGYQAAFENLSQEIRTAEAYAVSVVPEDLEPDARARAQLNVVQNRLADASDAPLGAQMDSLFYFFDKLSVCVDRNLCDADLLEAFFKDNLTRMWIYSSSFVAKREEEIAGYAQLTDAYQARLRAPKETGLADFWPF